MRTAAALVFVGLVPLVMPSASSAAAADLGPWAELYADNVVDTINGDLDGDGRAETARCLQSTGPEKRGGIVILGGKGPVQLPLFHVELDQVMCQKVRIQNQKLGILLAGKQQLVWEHGKEIHWARAAASPLWGTKVSASTQLDSAHAAAKAFDGDINTSWAEGAQGTGIGQTITLKFPQATDIAAISVVSGDLASSRSFFDSNRVHRGSVETKTASDMGDVGSGVDFGALGIDTLGERIEFTSENRASAVLVPVNRKGVIELNIRIESVYLGDKRDDTHIAEIEIVPLISLNETVDKAKPVKAKANEAPKATPASAPELPESTVDDEVTKKLDAGGRGITGDDGLQ